MIDDIKLPPLPKGDIDADTCPVMWVHTDQQMENYAREAIKADRQRRSEPVVLATHHVNELSRAIEQAVLQSPEVQALKRDKERLDWLADPENSIGNVQLPTVCVERNPHSMRDAIDAAMGKSHEQ